MTGQTDGRSGDRTDRRTDGRMFVRTDQPSHCESRNHARTQRKPELRAIDLPISKTFSQIVTFSFAQESEVAIFHLSARRFYALHKNIQLFRLFRLYGPERQIDKERTRERKSEMNGGEIEQERKRENEGKKGPRASNDQRYLFPC